MSDILNDDTEALLGQLQRVFDGKKPASRASSKAKLQKRIRDMESDLRKYILAGHSATAIAKELAPKGSKPTWETVRRVMISELALKKRHRSKSGSKSDAGGDRKNDGKNENQSENKTGSSEQSKAASKERQAISHVPSASAAMAALVGHQGARRQEI
jgi:hypothetical protein